MNKFLASMVLTLATLTFANQAHAGFMVEPFVGYEMGKFDMTGAGGTDDKTSGTELGARIGMKFVGFMFGAEYSTSTLTADPSVGANYKVKPTDLGIFVGFNFPVLFRVYATYFVKDTTKIDAAGAFPKDFTGTGSRIGIGFTGLPFVSINLEVVSRTLDKYDGDTITSLGGKDLKSSGTVLSVSLPLP